MCGGVRVFSNFSFNGGQPVKSFIRFINKFIEVTHKGFSLVASLTCGFTFTHTFLAWLLRLFISIKRLRYENFVEDFQKLQLHWGVARSQRFSGGAA